MSNQGYGIRNFRIDLTKAKRKCRHCLKPIMKGEICILVLRPNEFLMRSQVRYMNNSYDNNPLRHSYHKKCFEEVLDKFKKDAETDIANFVKESKEKISNA